MQTDTRVDIGPLYTVSLDGSFQGKKTTRTIPQVAKITQLVVQRKFDKNYEIPSTLDPEQARAFNDYTYWGGTIAYYKDWIAHVISRCWAYYKVLSSDAKIQLTRISNTYANSSTELSQQAKTIIEESLASLNRIEAGFLFKSKNRFAIESALGIDGYIFLLHEAVKRQPEMKGRCNSLVRTLLEMKYGEGYYDLEEAFNEYPDSDFAQFLRHLTNRMHKAHRDIYNEPVLMHLILKDIGGEYQKMVAEFFGSRDPETIAMHLLSLGYPEGLVSNSFALNLVHNMEQTIAVRTWDSFNVIAAIYEVIIDYETRKGVPKEKEGEWLHATKLITTPFLFLNEYIDCMVSEIMRLPITSQKAAQEVVRTINFEIEAEFNDAYNTRLCLSYLRAIGTESSQLEIKLVLLKRAMRKQVLFFIKQHLDFLKTRADGGGKITLVVAALQEHLKVFAPEEALREVVLKALRPEERIEKNQFKTIVLNRMKDINADITLCEKVYRDIECEELAGSHLADENHLMQYSRMLARTIGSEQKLKDFLMAE